MLVLTRKIDEPIDITAPGGAPIEIRVLEINGNSVRIGIKATNDVIVNRREVTLRLQAKGEAE